MFPVRLVEPPVLNTDKDFRPLGVNDDSPWRPHFRLSRSSRSIQARHAMCCSSSSALASRTAASSSRRASPIAPLARSSNASRRRSAFSQATYSLGQFERSEHPSANIPQASHPKNSTSGRQPNRNCNSARSLSRLTCARSEARSAAARAARSSAAVGLRFTTDSFRSGRTLRPNTGGWTISDSEAPVSPALQIEGPGITGAELSRPRDSLHPRGLAHTLRLVGQPTQC